MIFGFESLHNFLDWPPDDVHFLKSACPTAPWGIKRMGYGWYFLTFNKHNVSPLYLQQKCLALEAKDRNYCLFYIVDADSLLYDGCTF